MTLVVKDVEPISTMEIATYSDIYILQCYPKQVIF